MGPRLRFRLSHLFPLAALCVALAAAEPRAQANDPRHLQQVEQELDRQKAERQRIQREAASARSELNAISSKLVESAKRVQDQEEALSTLEKRLASLKREDTALREALVRRDEQATRVLTAIQRLALRPTETLLAQPAPPADTVRVAILLRQAIPHIRRNADDLAAQLAALHHLDTAIRAQRAQIKSTGDKLRSEHANLAGLMQSKQTLARSLQQQSKDVEARMARLSREAQDMRDLLNRLEAEKVLRKQEEIERQRAQAQSEPGRRRGSAPPPKATPAAAAVATFRPFETMKGRMPFPARGALLAGYGEKTSIGETLKGLRIETRGAAQVIAPHEGTAVFAEPFLQYGNLLIIDHGEGYHVLLAGLGRIDVKVGQVLTSGEPVGIMPATTGSQNPPALYMELRRNGQPINPLPWLQASKGDARG